VFVVWHGHSLIATSLIRSVQLPRVP
jgi:hypothetical protein